MVIYKFNSNTDNKNMETEKKRAKTKHKGNVAGNRPPSSHSNEYKTAADSSVHDQFRTTPEMLDQWKKEKQEEPNDGKDKDDPNDVGNSPYGYGADFAEQWRLHKIIWPQLTLRDRGGLIRYLTDLALWEGVRQTIMKDGPLDEEGKPSGAYILYEKLTARLNKFSVDVGASAAHRNKAPDTAKKKKAVKKGNEEPF